MILLFKTLRVGRAADWKGVLLQEILSTHSKKYPSPPLKKEKDGLGLYQLGEQAVWFPLSFDPSFLSFCYDEIFIRKIYESKLCLIGNEGWVVDAGACEGLFSLYALERGAKVLVFEPIPELARDRKSVV